MAHHSAVYKTALTQAKLAFASTSERLERLFHEREEAEADLVKLRRTITALAAMCSDEPLADALGITESIAEIMSSEPTDISTTQVVEALERMGFDLKSQKNAAASAHAVLKRLAQKGEIERRDEFNPVRWRGPKYDPSTDDIPF